MKKKIVAAVVSAVTIIAVLSALYVLLYSQGFFGGPSGKSDPGSVDQTLEKYYDYFSNNNWQITSILAFTNNTFDFSDDALATFAVMGLPGYNWETGHTREEYDAVTDKYFGRSAVDYRTSMTEIIPETERIRAVGWSFDSTVHMVLRDLSDNSDGSITAHFYALTLSDSFVIDEHPELTGEQIKSDLLSGRFDLYGQPELVELVFREKEDENGVMFLFYLSAKRIDTNIAEITPYS